MSGADVSNKPVSRAPGIYVPDGWGQYWRTKLASALAGSSVAKAAIAGDSVSRGYFASNLNSTGWAALMAATLQSRYGDGGSGWQGVVDSNASMTALSVPAGARTAYAAQQVGATGAWSVAADTAGPGASYQYSTTSGNTLTFTVRGTSVTLVYRLDPSGSTAATWSIDGNAQTPINTQGTAAPASVTVSGLSSGSHTVVVTVPAGGAIVVVYGCVGSNASGVRVDNFSKYGAGSAAFATGGLNWSGGPSFPGGPADLLIYHLSMNDAGAGSGQDAWQSNAGNAARRFREVADPKTDILYVLGHVGNNDNAVPQYPGISSRARSLAESTGAALLNLWTLGRNSWAYWNALSYWSDTSGTGASGTDTVHPGNTGHQYIANQVLGLVG